MTDLLVGCQTRPRWLLLLALLVSRAATADVIDSLNTVRDGGCGGRVPAVAPLHESARLDEVAKRLSQGSDLRTAERSASYHAVSSFSVSVSPVQQSGDVERLISRQFCREVSNPAFREFGSWRRGAVVWIALAEPFTPPAARERAAISRRVLELTNEARSAPRRCGSTPYASAPPLTLNATLTGAAREHSRDMALWGYMDHTGHDGSTPQARISRAGYRWQEVGENLASGIMRPEEVVAGWLRSPEHCANLMDPLFRQMGVAFAVNAHDDRGVYWAQEFGAPR